MDCSNLEKNPVWFVSSCYTAAGRPKAEDATMTYARDKYMYTLIPDYMVPLVVKDLIGHCARLRQENKRLGPVIIVDHPPYTKDHKTIHIGAQSLTLCRVKGVVE